ncbi:BTAD domain-containing putative transcriptional regulator [Kineococcus gypseus]|uniref:AfsR/SARP family transcriptional regulator n=1 Tax=Kineococcus gypseus TaxID=1637102 RepID=UPI003D7CF8CC
MVLQVDVLGPLRARRDGVEVALGGPRQRELLGRLAAARGRAVTTAALVRDLWEQPPPGARGALATAVGELRRRLEPERAPRTPPRTLLTTGAGYALRLDAGALDAARLEAAPTTAPTGPGAGDGADDAARLLARLGATLADWRGQPYADLPGREWVLAEREHLGELHARATERYAAALLRLDRSAEAVGVLDAHTRSRPWRERGWADLALALYRERRRGEALAVLRRARALLAGELGLDPGPELVQLERDVLTRAPHLDLPGAREGDDARVATRGADRVVVELPPGESGRLRTSVDLARTLAYAGGQNLAAAQHRRLEAALAAEASGDALLTARLLGAYDVPTVWTRSDDPVAAAAVVALTRRTLERLGDRAGPALRARLLAVLALEHRGTRDGWALQAALEAERTARTLGDPVVLLLALDARFVQSFQRPGAAGERERIGAEITELALRHDLGAFTVLGHLVRLQASAATGAFADAERYARAAEAAGDAHGSPVARMLTAWFWAMRTAQTSTAAQAAAAYRGADRELSRVHMPGVREGLLPLALLCLRLRHDRPRPSGAGGRRDGTGRALPDPAADGGWGPHLPWVEPVLALDGGDPRRALRLAGALPEPPADHLREVRWALVAHAALRLGSPELAGRAHRGLSGSASERAGAGSGLLDLGPVGAWLTRLEPLLR